MIVTPQFLGIANADGKVALQSITCRDEDSDQIVLSTLDSVGATVKMYAWINYGGDGTEKCWVDTDTYEKPVEEVYFDVGSAVWVQAENVANVFTTAGQVNAKDIAVQLQNGNVMVGNASPVTIDLQDILCEEDDSDQVVASTLDSVGATIKMYAWINYGGDGTEKCWVDTDTYERPDPAVKLAPGEGLWVQGESTENVITFPGVEL